MSRPRISGPQKTVDVPRGLFVLRYEQADVERLQPTVRVSSKDATTEIIFHPDVTDATLHAPGAAAVIHASAPTTLIIEVVPAVENGSEAASLKLDPLSIGREAPAQPAPRAPAKTARRGSPAPVAAEPVAQPPVAAKPVTAKPVAAQSGTGGLKILGHVAGIGDVVVDADRWIAGPASPSRIEGISIDWPDRPADVVCRYAVKFAKPRGATSAMTDAGEYAGSRKRALALVGVVLELSGPGAARYKFQTEALFLGSPVMKASGQRVVLGGPTGGEPLVGLRLAIQPAKAAAPEAPRPVAPAKPAPAPAPVEEAPAAAAARPSGRVRVFRSRPKPETAP
ncbi:hypothetical protein [Blastochloris tepida]|uniref:Uncharacterized protein n=1 Tax=Blastochloris tepida TaxID=2233851 RepID=A0A348FZG4_9HYPH|nr:hypothetical protein [Blastochloris tepida]BBF92697.1 hypothetical protein BLTE_13820 [Blastochloris tepida]